MTDEDTDNNLERIRRLHVIIIMGSLTSRMAKVTLLPASSLPSSPPSPRPETSAGTSGSAGLWLAGKSSLRRDLVMIIRGH